MRRFKLICCEILFREACRLVAESPAKCDVEFLPKGLHDLGVEKMRPRLQERIDAAADGGYEAVLMGYGLCNNGLVGLEAKRVPLVVPRAHDCITLFLGDRGRYREYFDSHPGTYYHTTGWLERNDSENAGDISVSQRLGLFQQYEELVRQYGEENAKYIQETLGSGVEHYDRITYIRMGLACEEPFVEQSRREAASRGWTFEEVQGSLSLLRKLVNGDWDADMLVIPPGQRIAAAYDDRVIRVEAGSGPAPAGS